MSMIFDLRRVSRDEANALNKTLPTFPFLHGTEPQEPPKDFLRSLLGDGSQPKNARTWQEPAKGMIAVEGSDPFVNMAVLHRSHDQERRPANKKDRQVGLQWARDSNRHS